MIPVSVNSALSSLDGLSSPAINSRDVEPATFVLLNLEAVVKCVFHVSIVADYTHVVKYQMVSA